tara:strand:+ start:1676 stop:2344 length:669 start_codon:yes stop_codon:yes gene_type:complete
MINIKNKQNYLKLLKYFIIIFSIFLLSSFLFKNSLYSYLIFIIISNIIFYILDKKNIYNLFFITVIITCILYIYSYNNIIEPQNNIDKTCKYIASTGEYEYAIAANNKQNEINTDIAIASRLEAATKYAVIDGDKLQRKKKHGTGDIPSLIHDFTQDNKVENVNAKKDHKKHEGRNSKLKDNQDNHNRGKIWYDTYCNNTNNNIKRWAGYTSKYYKKQAEII